jgi:hypothetical protein
LEGDASDKILQAVTFALFFSISVVLEAVHAFCLIFCCFGFRWFKVKDLLKHRSPLKSDADAVTVLDGTQEGAYQWVWFMNIILSVIYWSFLMVWL